MAVKMSMKSIRKHCSRHISYVTQETFLFQDTIENNIKVAKADATREEVCAAAKKAAIHEFIESLPNGYDTKLSELGEFTLRRGTPANRHCTRVLT